jgi:hypothetical protein
MADETLDPEIIRKLNEGIELSAEEQAKLAASASASSRALNMMTKTLDLLGRQTLDYAAKMNRGEKGAATFNDAIGAVTDALGNFLNMLGPLGKALGLLVKGAGMYVKQVNEMSDRLYKSYQGLAETGTTAADGMMGVADAAQRMGYGLDQIGLDQFAALMKAASQDLALMSGSAAGGRKALTDLSNNIVKGPTGEAFMNLGLSIEAQNEAIAAFVKTQVATGRIQRMSTEEQRQGAIAYIRQLDELTKLTGVSAKDQQNAIEANQRNERFAATVEKVRREQGDVAANNLVRNMGALSQVAPDVAAGLMDISGGFVTTEAARKAELAGFRGVAQMLTGDIGPALNQLSQQAQRNVTSFQSLAQVGVFGDTFGAFHEQLKLAGLSTQDLAKVQEALRKTQADQEAGLDPATKAQTQLQRAQMNTRDSLQTMVLRGVEPATRAMAALAKTTAKVAGIPEESLGLAETAGGKMTTGGGATGQGPGSRPLGVMAGAASGATLGAMLGSVGGLPGAVLGGLLGGVGGGIVSLIGRGPSAADTQTQLEDLFTFAGNTGSMEHFRRLQPQVQQSAIQMAQEYLALTGEKLQVNSAFRSIEEQRNIDPGSNPKAAPGRSLHQQGRAIDFNSAQVSRLMSQGLLEKYGFKSGAAFGDPPHVYMQDGGIATGPRSGYNATLHGTEAVVPLPDGKTIPVTMPELSNQVNMMSEQISRLDELIALMRNQNGISSKILQAANN